MNSNVCFRMLMLVSRVPSRFKTSFSIQSVNLVDRFNSTLAIYVCFSLGLRT